MENRFRAESSRPVKATAAVKQADQQRVGDYYCRTPWQRFPYGRARLAGGIRRHNCHPSVSSRQIETAPGISPGLCWQTALLKGAVEGGALADDVAGRVVPGVGIQAELTGGVVLGHVGGGVAVRPLDDGALVLVVGPVPRVEGQDDLAVLALQAHDRQ